jgi:hypothetical protein
MKQKYEGKDLQSLVQLGREQGYLTFDQVNDFLPPDVSSPTDLRSALESFQDMDIKVLADVPADGMDSELEAEVKEGPDEGAAAAPAADSISESSDPVRLYLREMSNFQLLSREQEVEIAKRIEAGENEVEEEVLRSPVTLDLVIEMGARVEAGEADLRDIFEENQEPDDDEEGGREANEKQLKKLLNATTKLKSLHSRIEDIEDKLKDRPKPILKTKLEKSQVRLTESVERELHHLELSRHLREAVIGEMRRLLPGGARCTDADPALRTGDRPQQVAAPPRSGRGRRPPPCAAGQRQPRKPARYRRANQSGTEVGQGGRAPGQGCDRRICVLARNDRVGPGQEPAR